MNLTKQSIFSAVFYIRIICFEYKGNFCAIAAAAFSLFCFEPLYLQGLEIIFKQASTELLLFFFFQGWLAIYFTARFLLLI